MEGYLQKWVNIVQRWQRRYFVLNEDTLVYCKFKAGPVKGQIHLKISAIILQPDDPLGWIINTGTTELNIRAATVKEKINWVDALQKAQEQCLQLNGSYTQNMLSKNHLADNYNRCLAEIWVTQAQFDETLSLLKPKLEKNSNVKELAQKLEILGKTLKNKITICTQMLEEERNRQQLKDNTNQAASPVHDFPDSVEFEDLNQSHDDGTLYESFNDLEGQQNLVNYEDPFLIQEQKQINTNQRSQNNQQDLSINIILQDIKLSQPIKYKNLINSKVFKNLKISTSLRRDKLPRTQDPKEKLNFWNLLKNLIGKDLSKFAVPVQLNEPLSLLQRLSEQMEYFEVLQAANQEQDSCLRMCYIMGFAVSVYAANIDRTKKPFNPILGETFELVNKDFKFVSEQVSHHPPISAGYADSPDFVMWTHSAIQSNFKGKSMEVKPLGLVHVILKQFEDHYTFNKCVTYVKNILFGEMYLDNVGDMIFKNHKTNETAVITLIEKGWNNKGAFEMNGIVKDNQGVEKYKLFGHWNDQLIATNIQTQEQKVVWKRHTLPPNYENYYFFTDFAMQLNHINADLLKTLPCTDCRLRPDQQALEQGKIDLASDEKFRLEEKQRARRKVLKDNNETHQAQFFVEAIDPLTQEKQYIYNQKYWEQKTDSKLDLF